MKFSTSVILAFIISAVILMMNAFGLWIFNEGKPETQGLTTNTVVINKLSANSFLEPAHYNRSIMNEISNTRINNQFSSSFPQNSCVQAFWNSKQVRSLVPFTNVKDDELLVPASVNKIVTASAILTVFSPDATLDTSLIANEKTPNLSVAYLQTSGDPSFVSSLEPVSRRPSYFSPENVRTFNDLAQNISKQGIKSIASLVIDDTWFKLASIEPGWAKDKAEVGQISGFNIDEGFDGANLSTSPRDKSANTFVAELNRLGVQVGKISFGSIPEKLTGTKNVIAVTKSPKIKTLISDMLKTSNNVYAEELLASAVHKSLGVVDQESRKAFMEKASKELGVNTQGYIFVNGSGYSSESKTTCSFINQITSVVNEKYSIDLADLSSKAGKDGTLTKRFTDMNETLSAKTGTLDNVTALSGNLNDSIMFTFISNGSFSLDTGHNYQVRLVNLLNSYPSVKTLEFSAGVLATR